MKYIYSESERFFAFNVWDVNSAKSIIDAAGKLKKNIILQTSSRIFSNLDKEEFYQYIKGYAKKMNVDVYFHLDHCRDFSMICEAIHSKWDSVMFDGSHLPLVENIKITNEVCEIAHKNDVLVEAEVGQIKGVEENITSESDVIADIVEIETFFNETNIDLFAAAIGTAHGLYKGEPQIHYELIDQIRQMKDIPFVIHGGTGLSEAVFRDLLSYKNVKKINISTEVKQSYRKAIVKAYKNDLLAEKGFEATQIEQNIHDEIMNMAYQKIKLLIN
jgi:Fructose/tagatose bisphosphate aldolase